MPQEAAAVGGAAVQDTSDVQRIPVILETDAQRPNASYTPPTATSNCDGPAERGRGEPADVEVPAVPAHVAALAPEDEAKGQAANWDALAGGAWRHIASVASQTSSYHYLHLPSHHIALLLRGCTAATGTVRVVFTLSLARSRLLSLLVWSTLCL